MIFLVQSPHPWSGIRQRPHHLMTRFAKWGHLVRWVEPRYLSWIVQRRADFFRARRAVPHPNLQVHPVLMVNGERVGAVRGRNLRALSHALSAEIPPFNPAQLEAALERQTATGEGQAGGPRVLWLYNPHEARLADLVPHELLVYDIMDEFQGFPWSPPNIANEESELLRRADWIFAGTGALYNAKRQQVPHKIECLLSGVDTGMFTNVQREAQRRMERDTAHQRALTRSKRIIGYAGMIDLRLDQELLVRAANECPDWGFVLIGPVCTDISRLTSRRNIHLLGPRDYKDLGAYYKCWDATMLPFVRNLLTEHINPTKMLEYAASGRPIIARGLPDVRKYYADGAWLYETGDEFIDHLRHIAIAPEDDDLRMNYELKLETAMACTRERNWDAISKKMYERVAGLLEEKLKR